MTKQVTRWMTAGALAILSGGCADIFGLDKRYYLADGGEGGSSSTTTTTSTGPGQGGGGNQGHPAPHDANGIVSAGSVAENSQYRMVSTLGQSAQGQTTSTNSTYQMRSGLVGSAEGKP